MIDIDARNKWIFEALDLGSQEANRVMQAAVSSERATVDPLKTWLLAAVDAALEGALSPTLTCYSCNGVIDDSDEPRCGDCHDRIVKDDIEEATADLRADFDTDRHALEDRISDLVIDAREGTTDATLTELRQAVQAERAKCEALEKELALSRGLVTLLQSDLQALQTGPVKKPRAPRKPKA